MVLQGSPPISLSDIRGEFGGTAPDSLSEYYRGGGLVPDTPANAGIPTSGQISILDFLGGDASAGIGFTTGAIFGMSNVDSFATDGGGSNVVICQGGGSLTMRRTSTANLATPIWLTQSNAANPPQQLAYLSGTTVYAANRQFAGSTNFSLRNTSAFTSTGFSTLSGLSSGPSGPCTSVATNGSTVVTTAGNVHWYSTNPTAGTPTWTRVVTGTVVGTNAMQYFSGTGQNLFVEWTGGTSGQIFAYDTTGIGTWTNGAFPLLSPTAVSSVRGLAVKESGGTVTAVAVGNYGVGGSPSNGPAIFSTTGATLATCLNDSTWTASPTPTNWDGVRGASILWIPAANSSAGYFVACDNNGNFARSSTGSGTWTPFDTALSVGGINDNSCVDLGSKSMWGTTSEGVLTFNAADIP